MQRSATDRRPAADDLQLYRRFSVDQWRMFRGEVQNPLSDEELAALKGINEHLTNDEMEAVYLPAARLLMMHYTAHRALYHRTADFLERQPADVPFVIGLAGSVAVGKSTAARVLQAVLARWPGRPKVILITTDGFLFPNRELQRRRIMNRKGFPESYDRKALLGFLAAIKAGERKVTAPVYSHLVYDIVPGRTVEIDRPDILILEGLNVLQTGRPAEGGQPAFVSDFFDYSIYLHADETVIRRWYTERFLTLRETAFSKPESYFRHYTKLSPEEAVATAKKLWDTINLPNLHQNILQTKERARLVLHKGDDHRIEEILLRRF